MLYHPPYSLQDGTTAGLLLATTQDSHMPRESLEVVYSNSLKASLSQDCL